MAEVLVDTSAWICALRGTNEPIRDAVDELLNLDEALFCGVVEMELLHGMRPRERELLLPLFEALRYVEIDREDWKAAGNMLADMQSRGTTIPASDALIGCICLRHGLEILTTDRHFEKIPGLKRRSCRKRT
jgi:predicted nucleic acid-binding protein